jgi:2,4-dienoyl-CoA reductase-like NADH-dependent reductase (Old Yellow Enzyme family)
MDVIFQPLEFRNLTVKNRIFHSNVSGRFDNYDGPGNLVRINWELKFARSGVGAIISSFVPVSIRGRIVPSYATIHHNEAIPFWRELGRRVHEHHCHPGSVYEPAYPVSATPDSHANGTIETRAPAAQEATPA